MTRSEISHKITMDSFREVESNSIEKRELYRCSFLSEAGDALEDYLSHNEDDMDIIEALIIIDAKLTEIRNNGKA